jgi:hypothetical protein
MGAPTETAYDVPGVTLHRGERCVDGGTSDGVVDDVEAFSIRVQSHVLFGRESTIVDRDGTEAFRNRSLLRRDCGEDLCAQSFCDLYGYVSDAACSGMYQNLLTAMHFGSIDEAFPCGDGDERKRSGFAHGERLRFERNQLGIGCDIFGERSLQAAHAADHAVYVIARMKCGDGRACFFHDTRQVETKYRGQSLVGVACLPGTDLGIERIDAACVDAYQDLRGLWFRTRQIGFGEWAPGMLNDVSLQDGSP